MPSSTRGMLRRLLQPTLLVWQAILLAGAGAQSPNIVMILTDDLDWSLVQFMPNVKKMRAEGVSFVNNMVTDSMCCPSRASTFTGRVPHNTGVVQNGGDNGGYGGFNAKGNQIQSFAVPLKARGYATSMSGKYLNGYNASVNPPAPGWTSWAVSDEAYGGFNYNINIDGQVVHHGNNPSDYLTDVLNARAVNYVKAQKAAPFMMEISTFSPHSPYTPAPRDANLFPGLKAPRQPSFNATMTNAPAWLAALPPLTANLVARIDVVYRLRAQAVQSIDKLVGDVRAEIARQGLKDNTYVFFTSDNGYHLGSFRMSWGKQTAFTTDIRVPLIVVGPGIAPGRTIGALTQNTDLCPTFAELAGVPISTRDGVSLVPFLKGLPVARWRKVALVEHTSVPTSTTGDPDMVPGGPVSNFAVPPTYQALRAIDYVYVEYKVRGTTSYQYHNLTRDPDQMINTYTWQGATRQSQLRAQLQALRTCQGASCFVV